MDRTTAAQDNRSDVSSRISKPACRVSTTAALAAYTRSGNTITADANGALGNIDGVNTAVGDRILFRHGASAADNGIWYIVSEGAAGAPFILRRAWDMEASTQVRAGTRVHVSEGTVWADSDWVVTTNDAITLNTTALSFGLAGKMSPSGYTYQTLEFTQDVDFSDLGSGASDSIALVSFPTNVAIQYAAIEINTAFAGEADLAVTVGDTADADGLISSFNLDSVTAGWAGTTVGSGSWPAFEADYGTAGGDLTFSATELDDVSAGNLTLHIFYQVPRLGSA